MSRGDLFAYWHRMLDRFIDQNNVPIKDKSSIKKQLIIGLKEAFDVKHMSKLNSYDRWAFVQKCEVLLIREYGYEISDDMKLKFEN